MNREPRELSVIEKCLHCGGVYITEVSLYWRRWYYGDVCIIEVPVRRGSTVFFFENLVYQRS